MTSLIWRKWSIENVHSFLVRISPTITGFLAVHLAQLPKFSTNVTSAPSSVPKLLCQSKPVTNMFANIVYPVLILSIGSLMTFITIYHLILRHSENHKSVYHPIASSSMVKAWDESLKKIPKTNKGSEFSPKNHIYFNFLQKWRFLLIFSWKNRPLFLRSSIIALENPAVVLTHVKPRLSLFTEARFILRHYLFLNYKLQLALL